MVDMSAIKGLQTTFHDIGRSTVGIVKNEEQGVAFGRNVSSPAKAAQGGGSVEQNNRAILGSILGKIKGAGANARLMKLAETALNKLDQSKPLTGRNVERAMGQIKKAAVTLTRQETSIMKAVDSRAQKVFKDWMPNLLGHMSDAQGHDGAAPSKQAMDIMQNAFLKLCKLCVQDTGVPPHLEKMHTFMKDIGQSFLNRDTNKTIVNACTVLRTRLEGGQSPSEMAFHEKAAERGMNIPLDSNARNLLNTMWRAECQETFSGALPHKPAEGELERVLDNVLEKFFNRAALSFEGPQTKLSTTILNHSQGPSQGPTVESQEKKAHVDHGASTIFQTPNSTVHDDKKVKDGDATEAKADVKPAPQDETKPKTEAKPEAKPEEVKPEPKPDTKAETKPETKTEAKAEAKSEPKPQEEVKPEPKPEAQAEPKPAAQADTAAQGEVKPAVTPAATPGAKPEVKSDANSDDKVDSEVKGTPKPMDPGLAKVIQATKELEDLGELILAEAMEELEKDYNAGHFDADLGYGPFDTM